MEENVGQVQSDNDCATDMLEFLLWDEEMQRYKAVGELNDIEKKAVVANCGQLLHMLKIISRGIKDLMKEDLQNIWRRLDKIEKMLS